MYFSYPPLGPSHRHIATHHRSIFLLRRPADSSAAIHAVCNRYSELSKSNDGQKWVRNCCVPLKRRHKYIETLQLQQQVYINLLYFTYRLTGRNKKNLKQIFHRVVRLWWHATKCQHPAMLLHFIPRVADDWQQ